MRTLAVATLLVVITLASVAQSSDPTLHSTGTLVVVPTVVQNSASDLVYSLTPGDFSITDNGVPQRHLSLEPASAQPLSLVVLLQTGASAAKQFINYRHLETMLASILEDGAPPSRASNQVAIATFDSQPEAASPFTSDLAEWTDAINHPEPGDHGAAILDSLAFALRLLKQQPATNRRAILLISQPTDSGSKARLRDVLRTTAETSTAIYSVTFSPEKTAFHDAFTEPAHLNPPITVGPGNFQAYFNLGEPLSMLLGASRKDFAAEIATFTGGESARFDDRRTLEQTLGVFANHIRGSYLLTFQSSANLPGPHTLDVRLPAHPDFTIRARPGYWSADPPVLPQP